MSLKLFVVSRELRNCAFQSAMAKLGAMAGTGIMSRPSLMRLLPVIRRTSGKPQYRFFRLQSGHIFLVLFSLVNCVRCPKLLCFLLDYSGVS